MTNAAKLARHHRKGHLAERVEELRDWRFQEPVDDADPADLVPDFGLVRTYIPCVCSLSSERVEHKLFLHRHQGTPVNRRAHRAQPNKLHLGRTLAVWK